jgi:ABC-2 type transport system ATP-binding protein
VSSVAGRHASLPGARSQHDSQLCRRCRRHRSVAPPSHQALSSSRGRHDLTLDIPRGVVAGFIGPNAAGKTTTLAALLGLVRPTSGDGTVLGASLDKPERYLHRIGALIEGPALWGALTARENLDVLARLGGHARSRIGPVLDVVGLTERADDRVRTYSLGMRQRLATGAALLGDPELLVLDEPTNGLDPAGISDMRDLIRALGTGGRTLLVSSHLLAELEHVADWLVVIADGRLVHAGPAVELHGRVAPEVTLGAAEDHHVAALAQ